ncbi:hypothetical protein R0381_000004 [Jeongeupia wiesaeckerbachi]|uniref:hypothetical protein n=1 Tax=Jeongeupia wiesaeckerbachi TaxID=3051218 RepID=UPI003D802A09
MVVDRIQRLWNGEARQLRAELGRVFSDRLRIVWLTGPIGAVPISAITADFAVWTLRLPRSTSVVSTPCK